MINVQDDLQTLTLPQDLADNGLHAQIVPKDEWEQWGIYCDDATDVVGIYDGHTVEGYVEVYGNTYLALAEASDHATTDLAEALQWVYDNWLKYVLATA